MATISPNLYTWSLKSQREWLVSMLFIVGNILLPQLVHMLNQGGATWLPIYFFTLIGAYKYGWRVGLLTAVASPLLNCVLFGMPSAVVLLPVLIKSVVLAAVAGIANQKFKSASILTFVAVVIAYQTIGSGIQSLLWGNMAAAISDLKVGLPGMLLQVVGGWALVNRVIRK